ncbi:hypothetical protein BDV96DRAFT_654275 [Lophiotrema nucula]|uniref:Uncharacterized protein n=1 Tax=Lophiotrema nucula TaxID=690887 RepID=A0A6A5YI70_9PLEO|nr:hypothetical protein BDV96DRAFT_654275 [Lophiotrema nucula]
MAEPGHIVAIVFSGLFGTILLWLFIYFLHKWIHRRCEDLEHFVYGVWHRGREDYGGEFGRRPSPSPGSPPPKESRSRSRRPGGSPRREPREMQQRRERYQEDMGGFYPRREYPRLAYPKQRFPGFDGMPNPLPQRTPQVDTMPPVQVQQAEGGFPMHLQEPAQISPVQLRQPEQWYRPDVVHPVQTTRIVLDPVPVPPDCEEPVLTDAVEMEGAEDTESVEEIPREPIHRVVDYIAVGEPPEWLMTEEECICEVSIDEAEGNSTDDEGVHRRRTPRFPVPRSVPMSYQPWAQPQPWPVGGAGGLRGSKAWAGKASGYESPRRSAVDRDDIERPGNGAHRPQTPRRGARSDRKPQQEDDKKEEDKNARPIDDENERMKSTQPQVQASPEAAKQTEQHAGQAAKQPPDQEPAPEAAAPADNSPTEPPPATESEEPGGQRAHPNDASQDRPLALQPEPATFSLVSPKLEVLASPSTLIPSLHGSEVEEPLRLLLARQIVVSSVESDDSVGGGVAWHGSPENLVEGTDIVSSFSEGSGT